MRILVSLEGPAKGIRLLGNATLIWETLHREASERPEEEAVIRSLPGASMEAWKLSFQIHHGQAEEKEITQKCCTVSKNSDSHRNAKIRWFVGLLNMVHRNSFFHIPPHAL